ncbi:hypothetical protein [Kosakonia radicincitans]|uniref:hypothetical protein n=1 Tax=Kosakonia radicincitans TaxID=283686 RepID=UPI002367DC64|nr:hypothetical protein [Kosakonia radicincitans]MDD7998253.1 hypothetical protein [Kosakonia radicincitans]
MEMVRKNAPRGLHVRYLTSEERRAVINVFGGGKQGTAQDKKIAADILLEMDRRELLIACDCISGDSRPYNSEVEKTFIRHLKTSARHDKGCPLYHVKKPGKNPAVDDDRNGHIAPLVPAGPDDLFTRKTSPGQMGSGNAEDGRRHRKKLKPVPALGRVMMTILESAGINKTRILPVTPPPGLTASLQAITHFLDTWLFSNGLPASQLITTKPWQTDRDRKHILNTLKNSGHRWGKNRELCTVMLGLAGKITQTDVTFMVKGTAYTFSPLGRIKIFGEGLLRAGTREPYWVILRFRQDEYGEVYCAEGYAHAAFNMNLPIPVDSEKERATLKTIQNAAKYVSENSTHPPVVSLVKPLFTETTEIEGNKVEVHPDFLLTLRADKSGKEIPLVIETMGYDSEEYVERKSGTHRAMKTLGALLTDPHGFPAKSDTTFYSHLLSWFFNPLKNIQSLGGKNE